MKAEPCIIAFSFLLIAACFFPVAAGLSADAGTSHFQGGPVLTNMTTDSVTVTWWTEEPGNGSVSYRETNDLTDRSPGMVITDEQSSRIHRISLTSLTPNQTYSYSVSGRRGDYVFRTFPLNGTIRFVVYGDTREQLPFWNQSTHHALVAERIAAEQDILFVVHTGDLVNDPEDNGEWNRFFAAAEPILSHTPFYPVAGNHEQDSGVLQEIFGVPSWYVIRCGDVRVVVLDSNPLFPNLTAAQDRFVAENPVAGGTWKFVALHHPLYSADPNHPGGFLDVRERWEPVFIGWSVSAVFAAHVHAYEHARQNGIHYFTVATGGAPSYSLSPEKPEGYVTGLENTLGYTIVTVNGTNNQAILEYISVADVNGTAIRGYPPGTVYERVVLERRPGIAAGGKRSGFPILFTSQFGDREINLLI